MITYPFTYRRAKSVAEAEAMFKAVSEGKLLSGGQTLIAAMKMRLANPAELIDISGIKELNYIRVANGAVAIGAATPHWDVATATDVARAIPALARQAKVNSDPAVRHK